MAGKKKKAAVNQDPNERVIAENRKARHRFEVLDTLECGLVLTGTEVKSLREGRMSLDEAFGRVRGDEVWLLQAEIPPYNHAGVFNHEPKRARKLLLHRREIEKFANKARESGATLVPLRMYFSKGRVKVLMGLCKGLKLHDKREKKKKEDVKKSLQRAMRGRA